MFGALRERLLAIVAAMVISTWLVVSWIGRPLWDRLTELQERAQLGEQKLQRLQALAHRHPSRVKTFPTDPAFWSSASAEELQRLFLDELDGLARAGKLQLNLKPRPTQREGSAIRLSVELDVDATQESLLSFLDQLLMKPWLVELERFRITTTSSSAYPLRASLLLNKIILRK